ncbi:MAG: S1 RNA-binding domain-containing protein [Planctomycetota bacterium]
MRDSHRDLPEPESDHGAHTVRVWQGTIVGVHGDDVFVDLGPRMQGVISLRHFDEPPTLGEELDFTVLGQEDGLWALARLEEGLLASWSDMEVGSWVHARVIGRNPGGLDLKIGPLHAFMPKSETGLARGQDAGVMVGKAVTCEVIEIDSERQRVFVSRKRVKRKEKESQQQREVGSLKPGQVVQGRVSRIESYGAFVRFGQGLEGLIHISNLSRERVEHPAEVLKKGESISAEVLTVRQGGKRIGLGLKQLQDNPWKRLPKTHHPDQVVVGRVTRTVDFGAFVSIAKGIEGLIHESESGLGPDRRLREVLKAGQAVAVRIVDFDVEEERMSLSRVHRGGAPVRDEDALDPERLAELGGGPDGEARTNLGALIQRALRGEREGPASG